MPTVHRYPFHFPLKRWPKTHTGVDKPISKQLALLRCTASRAANGHPSIAHELLTTEAVPVRTLRYFCALNRAPPANRTPESLKVCPCNGVPSRVCVGRHRITLSPARFMDQEDAIGASIAERLEEYARNSRPACRAAGRGKDEVQLLAVSKTRPPDVVSAFQAGQSAFGENQLQDALPKVEHMRGHQVSGTSSGRFSPTNPPDCSRFRLGTQHRSRQDRGTFEQPARGRPASSTGLPAVQRQRRGQQVRV